MPVFAIGEIVAASVGPPEKAPMKCPGPYDGSFRSRR